MRETSLRPRRVSSIFPPDCLKTSSRIVSGMWVPVGSPYLAALASSEVEALGLFGMVFFEMGDDADRTGDGGEAFGDDGEAFLRGMEAYTVLTSAGFDWVSSSSCFTAASGFVVVLTATGGLDSVLIAATMDLVTRVGVVGVFSSFSVFSSSLSANKSSSSSELSAEASALFSSLGMVESRTTVDILGVGHVLVAFF